jgi:hypothetical protein
MDRQQKKLNKMVFKSLNNIYKNSRDIAKAWNKEYIEVGVLKEITDSAKLKDIESSDNLTEDVTITFAVNFNKMVDSIYNACDTKATELKSDVVNIKYLKLIIAFVIEEYKKAQIEKV